MSIETELTKLQTNMQNAYTSCNNKGATLPANQNFDNLATCIGTISGGGGYSEFPSYQVSNGVASRRSGALTGNEFSGITRVGSNGLYYAFYGCTGLTGTLDLSSLTSVGSGGLYYAFSSCSGLTSVNLSSLISVDGSGLDHAFDSCSGLTSVNLSSLTSVAGYGIEYAFRNCTKLTSVDFPSLKTITGTYALRYLFFLCTGLTDVYFRALTTTSFGSYTNAFNSMMQSTGTTTTHTLHFPSNLESTISGLSGYPLFGGTSGYVTISFDLPATS